MHDNTSSDDEDHFIDALNYYIMRLDTEQEGHHSYEFIKSMQQPKRKKWNEYEPDTSRIETSDITNSLRLSSGLYGARASSSKAKRLPLQQLLKMREYGLNGIRQFTPGNKSLINGSYLPNKLSRMDGYRAKVFCGTFAKHGDLFLTASQDFCIRVYDTSSGKFKCIKSIGGQDVGWSILDTALSPSGQHFIYCSWFDCIHMCNMDEDAKHQILPLIPDEDNFCVFSNCFSHDGREILCGANDSCLYVYNLDENQRTIKIFAHRDDVNSVAFADASSQIFFSAGDDGLCKVWDRRTLSGTCPQPVGILVGHGDGLTFVDSKGDSRYLITNSKDQSIKLWDMRMFSPSSTAEEGYQQVRSHSWDYRWQKFPPNLIHSRKRLSGDTSLMTYRGHSVLQTLIRCRFSPEATTGQQYIYTGSADGSVFVYDVLTGVVQRHLTGHRSCVRDVAWHPYRNEIYSSSWDGYVYRWTYVSKLDMNSDDEEEEERDNKKNKVSPGTRRSLRLAGLRSVNQMS